MSDVSDICTSSAAQQRSNLIPWTFHGFPSWADSSVCGLCAFPYLATPCTAAGRRFPTSIYGEELDTCSLSEEMMGWSLLLGERTPRDCGNLNQFLVIWHVNHGGRVNWIRSKATRKLLQISHTGQT